MLWGPTMLVAWWAGYSTRGRAMPSCSMTPCSSRWMSASDTWSAVRRLRAGALPSCVHSSRPRSDNRAAERMSVVCAGRDRVACCGAQMMLKRVIVRKKGDARSCKAYVWQNIWINEWLNHRRKNKFRKIINFDSLYYCKQNKSFVRHTNEMNRRQCGPRQGKKMLLRQKTNLD